MNTTVGSSESSKPDPTAEDPGLQRARLEIELKTLEIEEARRPFWKRPPLLVPWIMALLGLLAWGTSLITSNAQRMLDRASLEHAQAKALLEELNHQKLIQELNGQITELRKELAASESARAQLRMALSELEASKESAKRELQAYIDAFEVLTADRGASTEVREVENEDAGSRYVACSIIARVAGQLEDRELMERTVIQAFSVHARGGSSFELVDLFLQPAFGDHLPARALAIVVASAFDGSERARCDAVLTEIPTDFSADSRFDNQNPDRDGALKVLCDLAGRQWRRTQEHLNRNALLPTGEGR